MGTICEIAPDIYRINVPVPGKPVTFSMFLIDDDQPTLVEASYRALFPETSELVRRVVDPARLRYVVIPHFEGDECGALNEYLGTAPDAVPVASPVGANTSIPDFAIREPLRVDGESVLDLGEHRLRFLITPYVHAWDSMLAFDETTRTLFSSDLFLQPGTGPALTDAGVGEHAAEYTRELGLFPSRAHLDAALDQIEALAPDTLACHHGSVLGGRAAECVQLFREFDVTGRPPADPVHSVTPAQPSVS